MKMTMLSIRWSAACICLAAVSAGCGTPSSEPSGADAATAADSHEHEHPTEGPHHGALIELGAEEYHAELVHDDDNGTVTIYLLDSAAKAPAYTEADYVLINLNHDGEAKQFSIPAGGDAADSTGKASQFVSTDADLAEELDHEHGEAQLVVEIEGSQYRGDIHHDHDHSHEEHDHDH